MSQLLSGYIEVCAMKKEINIQMLTNVELVEIRGGQGVGGRILRAIIADSIKLYQWFVIVTC